MRFRLFLALSSASFLVAGIAVEACGGDTTDSAPTTTPDAATEATAQTPKDAGPDTADAAPKCDSKKDYLADIPDASIADGASTTSACVTCVESLCKTEVAACGADCSCQGVATDVLECFAKTMSTSCAASLLSVPASTQALGQKLFTCVASGCSNDCALGSFLDGGVDAADGGP